MFKSINGGRLPERATRYSCGFDVFANGDVVIRAGETKSIGLGITLDVDSDATSWYLGVSEEYSYEHFMASHYFALHIRSSLRAIGLTSLGTGIIDMDYRDEIKMVIHNPITSILVDTKDLDNGYAEVSLKGSTMNNFVTSEKYKIKKGDKIGQLVLCKHEGWVLPSEYTKDEERMGLVLPIQRINNDPKKINRIHVQPGSGGRQARGVGCRGNFGFLFLHYRK